MLLVADMISQVGALEVIHDQVQTLLVLEGVFNVDDEGVADLGEDFPFIHDALHTVLLYYPKSRGIVLSLLDFLHGIVVPRCPFLDFPDLPEAPEADLVHELEVSAPHAHAHAPAGVLIGLGLVDHGGLGAAHELGVVLFTCRLHAQGSVLFLFVRRSLFLSRLLSGFLLQVAPALPGLAPRSPDFVNTVVSGMGQALSPWFSEADVWRLSLTLVHCFRHFDERGQGICAVNAILLFLGACLHRIYSLHYRILTNSVGFINLI